VDEARIFGRYILGSEPCERAVALYAQHRAEIDDGAAENEAHLVAYALKEPWAIPCLDAALALVQPHALLRRKLLFLAAVLEAQPEHCDAFLPRERSPWYAFAVAWSLVRAAACAVAGLALLAVAR